MRFWSLGGLDVERYRGSTRPVVQLAHGQVWLSSATSPSPALLFCCTTIIRPSHGSAFPLWASPQRDSGGHLDVSSLAHSNSAVIGVAAQAVPLIYTGAGGMPHTGWLPDVYYGGLFFYTFTAVPLQA